MAKKQSLWPSLKTPGYQRRERLTLAAHALRDERTVAKWLRGESVTLSTAQSLISAADDLGIKIP